MNWLYLSIMLMIILRTWTKGVQKLDKQDAAYVFLGLLYATWIYIPIWILKAIQCYL